MFLNWDEHPAALRLPTCWAGQHRLLTTLPLCCTADWSQVVPLDYLNPFLDVILSPETSGPVTGVALTSVLRMLEHYTFGEQTVACGITNLDN